MKSKTLVTGLLVGLLVVTAAVPSFGMTSGSSTGSVGGTGSKSSTHMSGTTAFSGVGNEVSASQKMGQSTGNELGDSQQLSQIMNSIRSNPGMMSNYAAAGQLMNTMGLTGMKVFVNGQQVDFSSAGVQPIVQDGRTLVPVRSMLDALGATVNWNPSTQIVTVNSPSGTIQMTIGSNEMVVNGQTVTTDVPPTITNGHTMLPLRAMAEAMGMNVNWLAESDMAVLTSGNSTSSVSMQVYSGTSGTAQ